MAHVIDVLSASGGHVSPLMTAAVAIAIVLGALTRLIKAVQPGYKELQRTRRIIAAENEQTRRTSSVTLDAEGRIIVTGVADLADPKAVAEALHQTSE